MIIIADSGSTKTDWRILKQSGDVLSFKTVGLNPFYIETENIIEIVSKAFIQTNVTSARAIYFYGAGCINEEKCTIIRHALSTIFKNSKIEIESDMLGTARALFFDTTGFAAILGTGSNTCFYDGHKIINTVPSLGFIIGDEGSGSNLGKRLIKSFLRSELPENLIRKFKEKYSYTYSDILENIYKKPYPNKWLASFSIFFKENRTDTFVENMLKESFIDFFENQLCKNNIQANSKIGFTGSIAYVFSDIIKKIAIEKQLNIYKIIETPIEELINYHSRK